MAAFQKGASGKGWKIVFGAISILAGLIAIIHPFDVALTLTWILGIWFIVTAIFQGVGVLSIVLWVGVVAMTWGIILIIAAFAARRLGQDIDAARTQLA
ncbi:MAG: DUF308 domain-containing protein [Lapillicoccus sp.]